MSYSSAIIIEELDSDRTTLRSLTLLGPALPKMGASWPIENTLSTKFYPGNPNEGTQMQIVSREMPSDWEGEWNITRMSRKPSRFIDSNAGGSVTGSAQNIVSPGFLVDVIEDLARKGRRLRVTWAANADDPSVSRTIVREGRIKSWKPSYRGPVDVEWSITFDWVSRGVQQQRVAATRDTNAQGATTALQAAMAASQTATAALIAAQNDPSVFSLGQLEQIADAPLALVGTFDAAIENGLFTLQQIGGVASQFKNVPFNVAAQIVGTASDVLSTCTVFSDSLTGTPTEQAVLSDEVDVLTSAWLDLGETIEQAFATARQAQSAQAQMRAIRSMVDARGGLVGSSQTSGTNPNSIIGVRRTVAGDTPSSISNLYYGSPDHEIDILRANELPWYQASFVPGTILVIPAISATQGP